MQLFRTMNLIKVWLVIYCLDFNAFEMVYRGSQAQREDISITPYSADSSSGEASCSGSSTNEIDPYDPAGRRLSEDEKILLLTNTPCTFKFPVTSALRFNPAWLMGRPWSITNDRLFCISCMCFGSSSESPFVLRIGKKLLVKVGISTSISVVNTTRLQMKRQPHFYILVNLAQIFCLA